MTDFDIKQSDECDNRNETQRSQSERGVVDGSLHSEIEALIPDLRVTRGR